jgi:acyl-homoserine-lactone acylase
VISRLPALCLLLTLVVPAARSQSSPSFELWREVEVIRTGYGVPHIRAANLRAAGYALAWLQLEDHGPRTAMNLVEARGWMGRVFGRDSIDGDFFAKRVRARAVETYPRLEQATRDVYEGFAAGVNRYVELNPDEFPAHMPRDFTGYDVATLDIGGASPAAARNFLARLNPAARRDSSQVPTGGDADEGSNAWAFAPSRTKSGKAILLRNPHLAWTAGYYEAQMTVPGVVDYYGDFRIGGPFAVIGGFNRYLGWSTTNNAQDRDEVYALDVDPAVADHYLFEGASLPVQRELLTVEFRNGDGISTETREMWSTPLGPVIHRANGKIYVIKSAGEGEFRAGEQFLHMMRATSLAEWKEAMRIHARQTSNFTYADRAGNIFYVWNAALPALPHPSGGDSVAIPARSMRDVWTRYVPFDSLPQVLNPRGGYVHNENDSPHFTNIRGRIDTTNRYPNFERPRLSLRSQHALELIGGDTKMSLEDVVRLKHSYRMLLADRVKPDLVAAVKGTSPSAEVAAAIAMLERWDNTAAPDSRGSSLFEVWWQRYSQGRPDSLRFAHPWRASDPLKTPRGLADHARAAESFAWAVEEAKRRYGSWEVTWGDVHRVRRGNVDVPVGGCSGQLGCFRVMQFARAPDGKLVASGGDGWVLAVEFADTPRAYSVLAYGESPRVESPWHADQAAMFARGEMKRVAFTERDVDAQAVTRYRPGESRRASAGELDVLVYNVHAGKDAGGVDNLDRVAEIVKSSGAEIALLQEVDRGTRRSGGVDQPAEYAKRTGMHVAFGRSLNYDGGEYGIAILSRWPIRHDSAVPLVVDPPQLRSGASYEPRIAMLATIAAPDGDIVVVNTHLDASGDDSWRRQEAKKVIEIGRALGQRGVRRLLVGGDFNSTPESAVQADLASGGFQDAWSRCGTGDGLSYPATSSTKRIDYLYLVGSTTCSGGAVLTTDASDHRPVKFTVRFAQR